MKSAIIVMALVGAIAIQEVKAAENSISSFISDEGMEIIKKETEEQMQKRMEEKQFEEGRNLRKGKIVRTHSEAYLDFGWINTVASQIIFGVVCTKVAIPKLAPTLCILAQKITGSNEIEKLSAEQIEKIVTWAKSKTADIPTNFSEPKDVTYSAIGDNLISVLKQINIDSSDVSDVVGKLEKTTTVT